jgi:ABC-type transporter Mla subunit MlaD
MTTVTLEFLSRQVARVLEGQRKTQEQFADIGDQLTVLTAICLRHERALGRITERLERFENRITSLEDAHDQP